MSAFDIGSATPMRGKSSTYRLRALFI